MTQFAFCNALEFCDQLFPVIGFKLRIGIEAFVLFRDFQRFFEKPVVEPKHNVGIHLDEPAIAVPGKAFIPRSARKPCHRFIIETKVEHRIHHARHGDTRARANGHQQRVARIAKAFANGRFNMCQRCSDLAFQIICKICAFVEIFDAFFGCDREAWRDRQPDARHFRKVRTFTACDSLVLLARV